MTADDVHPQRSEQIQATTYRPVASMRPGTKIWRLSIRPRLLRLGRRVIFRFRILTAAHPRLEAFLRHWLARFPRLDGRLRVAFANEKLAQTEFKVLTTIEELDVKLAECEAAAAVSDDELRRVFTTFRMDISQSFPPDPFSKEYRDRVMALYHHIAGRPYHVSNEISAFNVAEADRRPFPYATLSSKTAGHFLMGTAFLLHALDLKRGARVVEFGPGWGNTTIWMAMLGFDVTAVDIEPHFCELLTARARRHDVNLTIVNDDFMWAEKVTDPFDAAVFFECFHHCSDHNRLLKALNRAVKPGGKVYFAAEPIVADFPIPWGLRMDGELLWAIRRNGWMELGFSENYFKEALRRSGWGVRKHVFPDLAWACVWEAQRIRETAALD